MSEIPASEVRVGDIGSRVIVIDTTGNAYTGPLSDVSATDWAYGKRPAEMVRVSITVKSDEKSKLVLTALPLDFLLQIDRSGDEHE